MMHLQQPRPSVPRPVLSPPDAHLVDPDAGPPPRGLQGEPGEPVTFAKLGVGEKGWRVGRTPHLA